MSRYVYIYVYVCVLVYVCVFIYVLIWVWVYSCMRVLVCECVYVCVGVCACLCWVNGRERECSYIISLNFWLSWTPLSHPIITFGSTSHPPSKKKHHSLSLPSRCISTHFNALFMCFIAFLVFFFYKNLEYFEWYHIYKEIDTNPLIAA